jgi:hypothetical protein
MLANLHALILDELVPACATLLTASQEAGETDRQITAYTLLRAIGNLCILGPDYDRNDARQMVARLLAGCRTRGSTISGPDAARSAQRPRSAEQNAV